MQALWSLTFMSTGVANVGADVVGCYTVFVEDTGSAPSEQVKSRHMVRAKDLRLTSEVTSIPWASGQFFQVLPLAPGDRFNYSTAYWELKTGHLSVSWSDNGLSGVEMDLTPTAIGFEGILRSLWDFHSATDTRRAILTHKPC